MFLEVSTLLCHDHDLSKRRGVFKVEHWKDLKNNLKKKVEVISFILEDVFSVANGHVNCYLQWRIEIRNVVCKRQVTVCLSAELSSTHQNSTFWSYRDCATVCTRSTRLSHSQYSYDNTILSTLLFHLLIFIRRWSQRFGEPIWSLKASCSIRNHSLT
jgi:hypothetical protein